MPEHSSRTRFHLPRQPRVEQPSVSTSLTQSMTALVTRECPLAPDHRRYNAPPPAFLRERRTQAAIISAAETGTNHSSATRR